MNVNLNATVDVDLDGSIARIVGRVGVLCSHQQHDRPDDPDVVVDDNVHGGVQVHVQVKVNVL